MMIKVNHESEELVGFQQRALEDRSRTDYLLESFGLVVLQIVVYGSDITDVELIELYSCCGPRGHLSLPSSK